MKKLLLFLSLVIVLTLSVKDSYSQRILLSEGFETSGMNADSLPTNWLKFPDVGPNPSYPQGVWAARDSGAFFPGVNGIIHSRAHTGHRGMTIAWRAADPLTDVANQWVFTDSVRVQAGDSLIFWMLLGTPEDLPLTNYIDTMQVRVGIIQAPEESFSTKLATIRSLDSNNNWTQYKFSLNQFAGQLVYIAFRYYMNTAVDGLWCNIDDIFVGNRSFTSVNPIGSNVPDRFALNQNYPNPFNPKTTIKFDLAKASNTVITVFDASGKQVAELVNGFLKAGYYETSFDATSLPSGTYFYKLQTNDFVSTKKMILVK